MSKGQQYKDISKILRRMNNQKRITLSIDKTNYDKVKKMGYNVSEVLDQFLAYLVRKNDKR